MSEKNICPGCGRHCDLSEPHCGRGEEYSRTGRMPEQQGKRQEHEMRRAHYQAADISDKLIINLRDLGHMMRMLYEGKASQKRILIILNEAETVTQRDLTERLGIQPGSASEILAKLEGAGWILRTQNEADRRTTDVRLTDSGRELAAEALEQRRKRHEEMFACLTEEERQELLSLLEKVSADWRNRYGERGRAHGRRHHDGHCHGDEHRHHNGHYHEDEHRHHGGHNHENEHRHHSGYNHENEHSHHNGHDYEDEHHSHDGFQRQGGN